MNASCVRADLRSEDSEEGQKERWINLSLLSLLAVGLGLIFCMLLFGLVLSDQPQGNITTVNTLATLRLPKISAPKVTPPLDQSRHLGTNTSAMLPELNYAVPEYSHAESECMESNCRVFVNWLRYKLDYNADPCEDFYKYVCSRFRGYDQFTNLQKYITVTNTLLLQLPFIPATGQIYWQKAAAMYQACTFFAESDKTETKYLVDWMLSLNLDLLNETRLATVNPVEMMVRGSLDLGVRAVISMSFRNRIIPHFKRGMTVRKEASVLNYTCAGTSQCVGVNQRNSRYHCARRSCGLNGQTELHFRQRPSNVDGN
ncbi:hypothetical protein HPB50_018836 [Hyalomma asiaticum]|uniref:Uncharacterized protein n=1 Tax=Hyalomma asiaticum TaxID=266040 RepID=A0ACB7SJ18_HYAAI|nr:hypothetical protein HPB50_018836 [Hyalomma asiaticum]